MDCFSRELRQLITSLGRVLGELTLQPVFVHPYAGLEPPSAPLDVSATLSDLQVQLERLQHCHDILPVFERDNPMPWLAEYSGEFDELPDDYPPQELVNRWRINPPASLHTAALSFAAKCLAHLQLVSERDLPAISAHWYSILGLITNGARFSRRLECDLVDAMAKGGASVTNHSADGDPLEYYVTALQMAEVVGYSKKTIERRRQEGKIPAPDITGGEGKAHQWAWSRIRPYLEREFDRPLPKRFHADMLAR